MGSESSPACTVKLSGRGLLNAILPFHTIWQFLSSKLQMNYSTATGNCRWRGTMEQEWSHEDRITPAGDTRHGSAFRPILNLSI
jgi:hypothetical protein